MVGRKGSVVDVAMIGILIFVLAIAFLITRHAGGTLVDSITNNSVIAEDNQSVQAFQSITHTTDRLDMILLASFIGLVIAFIITVWFIPASPMFLIIYWIGLVVIEVASIILSNLWETISVSNSVLLSELSGLPIANHILSHLPIYTAVIGFIGLIVLYSKPQNQQQEGGLF